MQPTNQIDTKQPHDRHWTSENATKESAYAFRWIVALFLASCMLAWHMSHRTSSRKLHGLIDPKTILLKDQHEEELRVIVFGDSIGWGATLTDRLTEAFPYLVSSNVTNAAIRANGPKYPSVCTQTMVGDEMVYDVIILQFFLRDNEGLLVLARRLRQRFPDAAIIFLRLWYPTLFIHTPSQLSLRDWIISKGVHPDLNSKEFHKLIKTTNTKRDWMLNPSVAVAEKYHDQIVEAVNGILWELPQETNPISTMTRTAHLFAEDLHHLSSVGHQLVADGIKEVLQKFKVKRHDLVAQWSQNDSCESWFSTGVSSLSYGPELYMNLFAEGPKYGLELIQQFGWITVTNPFPRSQMLHLAYMVTGQHVGLYRKTRITFRDHPEIPSIEIDPVVESTEGHHIHIVHVAPIAIMPPSGVLTLELEQIMEKDRNRPFRISGYAITPPQATLKDVKLSSFRDFSNHITSFTAHLNVTNVDSSVG